MDGGFWVFGYGSLIWQPGFDFADRRVATLTGYRRAFCMTSIVYRGTPEAPGLVLALDRGDGAGSCVGVAYQVAAEGAAATLAYLRERELVSYAYDRGAAAGRARGRHRGRGARLRLEPRRTRSTAAASASRRRPR